MIEENLKAKTKQNKKMQRISKKEYSAFGVKGGIGTMIFVFLVLLLTRPPICTKLFELITKLLFNK